MAEAIGLSIDTVTAAGSAPASTQPADLARLCRELLSVISLLSPDGVRRELLYLGTSSRVFAAGADDIDEALAMLASASLLGFNQAVAATEDASASGTSAADAFTADASTVTVHRLVMRVVRERAARDDALPDYAAKATLLLHAYVQLIGEPWQQRPAARDFIRQTSALTASVAPDSRAADDDWLLNLRSWVVFCAIQLADTPSQAVALAEQLAADMERVRGPSHPDTRACLSQLSTAYREAGRVREAVSLGERVLADCERLLGASDPDTVAARQNLANAYLVAGRAADAVPLLEAVLAVRESADGDRGRELISVEHSLAAAYRAVGRAADALPLFERVAAESELVLGPSHRDTLAARVSLANAYRAAGRLAEAVSLLEQARADYERVFGRSHPYTLMAGGDWPASIRTPAGWRMRCRCSSWCWPSSSGCSARCIRKRSRP